MTYIIYILTGALCNYFSCANLLPKISKTQRLIMFSYTFFVLFIFNKLIGQFSTYFVLTGLIFFTYLFTTKKLLSICCYLFGYIYAVTLNNIFLWVAEILFSSDMKQLAASDHFVICFSIIYCIFCGITTKVIGNILHKQILFNILNDSILKNNFISLLFISIIFILNFSIGEVLNYNYHIMIVNRVIFLLLFIEKIYGIYLMYQYGQQQKMEMFNQIAKMSNLPEESLDIIYKILDDETKTSLKRL